MRTCSVELQLLAVHHCASIPAAAGCRILGVEIDTTAQPVQGHPFSGNTAFMLGNEVMPVGGSSSSSLRADDSSCSDTSSHDDSWHPRSLAHILPRDFRLELQCDAKLTANTIRVAVA
jgi:hypothetical protein